MVRDAAGVADVGIDVTIGAGVLGDCMGMGGNCAFIGSGVPPLDNVR